jgi:pyruvate dehydrogenase E2 component (dihydrolipoamide acetyltransferase)
MATPIFLPKQGNTVETCLILEWKKKKNEEVKQGEIVCEIETEDDAPVLTNIAVVGKKGESYDEFLPGRNNLSDNKYEEEIPIENAPGTETAEKNIREFQVPTFSKNEGSTEEKISPRAKILAKKLSIPIDKIIGTGPGGRIIERDVSESAKTMNLPSLAAKEMLSHGRERPIEGSGIGTREKKHTKFTSKDIVKIVPLKGIRKLIAERMLQSLRNSAQLTLNSSVNAVDLLSARKKFKSETNYKKYNSVTINDLIHYAVTRVLPNHTVLNSALIEDEIYYYENIHLGFAVETSRGLMVPVIKNSQKLSLLELSSEAKRLSTSCNNNQITTDELNGATFTVTNLGNYDIESFTPILNLPQTAILGVNAINLKPIDFGKGVEFIPHISFSLTIDHRVIDGVAGAKFLQDISETITNINLEITEAG